MLNNMYLYKQYYKDNILKNEIYITYKITIYNKIDNDRIYRRILYRKRVTI